MWSPIPAPELHLVQWDRQHNSGVLHTSNPCVHKGPAYMTQMSVDPDCTLHITMLTLVNAGTYKLQVLGPGATYPLVSTDLCVYGEH